MGETHGSVVKRVCPACDGIGSPVSGRSQSEDPICPICENRGWVTNIVCKGCGRPAYFLQDAIAFCGKVKCLDKLRPVKIITTTSGEIIDHSAERALASHAWKRISRLEDTRMRNWQEDSVEYM